MKEIKQETINKLNKKVEEKKVQVALRRVLFKNQLQGIFEKQEEEQNLQFYFSNEIKTLPITNQRQSGRCWIFAGLNVLREEVAKKHNLKTFELSQNYTAFWDKFEKINYFIESVEDFLEADYDDRTFQHILKTGIQDGGQWDMFVSLVKKYGIVPKYVMPETTTSSNTRFMNQIINLKLRKYVAEIRKLHSQKKDFKKLKETVLEELYTFLVSCFGLPPTKFDFEYKVDEKYEIIKNLTPLKFFNEHVGDNLDDYVSIINAPTFDKPYMKTYTVEYLGNVVGGKDIKYLNLKMEELKELTIKQLVSGEVVWFGSDVSSYGNRQKGYWDDNNFDYETLLEMDLKMEKDDQLLYAQGAMNHAMVITGVHLDDNKPTKFKIENSWGEENGDKGYFITSNSWFDKYVYQSIIHKKYLTKEQLEAWNLKPISLKPWDPMGSLAK